MADRTPPWDVAIIGAGRAGQAMAAAALRAGRQVVLFERALTPDLAPFEARGATVVRASAHVIAADRIEAAGRAYPFRHAVIAAGHSPLVPDLQGLAAIPWLTPATLPAVEEAPAHLLILGGGAEAVALAQAQARAGRRVSLVQPGPNILPGEDLELVDPLRHMLRHDGVALHENSAVLAVEHDRTASLDQAVVLRLAGGARIAGSHLLLALGRTPNLAALDLPAGRIDATPRGVAVRRDLRSPSNPRVWAVGSIADTGWDSASHGQHAAIAAAGMLHGLRVSLPEAAPPRVVETEPALVQLGPTESAARAEGAEPHVVRIPLGGTPHGPGLVKLLADSQGRLLGASLLAPQAAEASAVLALALERGMTAQELSALPAPRGTLAEQIALAAASLGGADFPSSPMRRILGVLDRWH